MLLTLEIRVTPGEMPSGAVMPSGNFAHCASCLLTVILPSNMPSANM
jgi:hypothetical protein